MTRLLTITLVVLAVATSAAAQKPEPPLISSVGALLRTIEHLTREVAELRQALRERDARLQIATLALENVVKIASADPKDADGRIKQSRCADLERQLRFVEHQPETARFDCETLAFTRGQ